MMFEKIQSNNDINLSENNFSNCGINFENEKLIAEINDILNSRHIPFWQIKRFLDRREFLLKGQENGSLGKISEKIAIPISIQDIPTLNDIQSDERNVSRGIEALKRGEVAVCCFNGGLGTTMHLDIAKSLLPFCELNGETLTILDIKLKQINALREEFPAISFTTMDSTHTFYDTKKARRDFINSRNIPESIFQESVLRLTKDNLSPFKSIDTIKEGEFAPQGHGEIYELMYHNNFLQKLNNAGVKVLFLGNSDNLGATLSPVIAGYFLNNDFAYLSEIVQKEETDKKGGSYVKVNARDINPNAKDEIIKIIREPIMCIPEERELTTDINRHPTFNTNNLWISVPKLIELIQKNDGKLDLFTMLNEKVAKDGSNSNFVQIEVAAGSLISLFSDNETALLNVPRSERFWPIKNTADFMGTSSDRFILQDNGCLSLHPDTVVKGPLPIHWENHNYDKMSDYEVLIQNGIPSLRYCNSLTFIGNPIIFGKNNCLRGDVRIINPSNKTVQLPDDIEIEGEFIITQK